MAFFVLILRLTFPEPDSPIRHTASDLASRSTILVKVLWRVDTSDVLPTRSWLLIRNGGARFRLLAMVCQFCVYFGFFFVCAFGCVALQTFLFWSVANFYECRHNSDLSSFFVCLFVFGQAHKVTFLVQKLRVCGLDVCVMEQ